MKAGESSQRLSVQFLLWRWGGSLLICLLAWANLVWLRLAQANPYKKDIRQGYLLAKAMLSGVNPYLPLPELARHWWSAEIVKDWGVHPTPHPFAVGWLCLPLAALEYPTAVNAWLVFEVCCLLAALILWMKLSGTPWTWRRGLCASVVLLAWTPLAAELVFGQFALPMLALFLAAWLALRVGKDVLGGALLGSIVVLKLMGWPLLLWLAWRRRWRVIGAAATVWLSAHALAVGLHGWPLVRDYYLKVGPQVSAIYRPFDFNFSVWTIGERLFGVVNYDFVTTPLWAAPGLVKVLTLALPVLYLGWILWIARRTPSFDTSYAFLLGAGLFLNPVAWTHYFVLALPALVMLGQALAQRGWPRGATALAAALLVTLSLPQALYVILAEQFATGTTATGLAIIPALPALLTLLPVVALCSALWWLTRFDRAAAPLNAKRTAQRRVAMVTEAVAEAPAVAAVAVSEARPSVG